MWVFLTYYPESELHVVRALPEEALDCAYVHASGQRLPTAVYLHMLSVTCPANLRLYMRLPATDVTYVDSQT